MIDRLYCTGRETSIVDCMRDSWYQHNCLHGEDAGVDCIRKYHIADTSLLHLTTVTQDVLRNFEDI